MPQKENINDMLGAEPESKEENPLEKIEEASKDANKKPKESPEEVEESFDDETFQQILMAGDNTEGLFTPNEDKEQESKDPKHAEVDEDAKIKQGKNKKPLGKYANKFIEDISKNPQQYKVQTPKGEMTIAQAIKQGYNPITKRFEKDKSADEIKKKHLEGLNPADKAKLEELTNPAAARMAPKDAEAMGLPSDSPMIEGNAQPEQPIMMPPGAVPQGEVSPATVPQEGASPEGAIDINSILGGVN